MILAWQEGTRGKKGMFKGELFLFLIYFDKADLAAL